MDLDFGVWHLLVLLLIPALLIVGLILFRRALWPRRRGNEPHCAACNYLLIGNVSGRCPECGGDIGLSGGTRLGERHRRPGLACVAILMLFLGVGSIIAIATGIAQEVNWYQYRPASWVVQDLASSNARQANRAWNELDRRRKLPAGLSPAIEQKLIVLALKEQGQAAAGPCGTQLINYVGDMFLANKLSKAQTDLFFTQGMTFQLLVRPSVVVGDELPYLISHSGRAPSGNWWVRIHNVQAKLDGRVLNTGGSSTSSGFGGGSSGSYTRIATPGRHTIEVSNRVEFYHGAWGNEKASKLCYTRNLTFKAGFDALETAPADYVKLLDDATLKPLIRKAITVPQLERTAGGSINLVIDVNNAPANVAFDVVVRADGKEYAVGSITLGKGRQCSFGLNTDTLNAVTANKFDFILRSSEPAARRTTDLFEIWSGEIILQGVQVKSRAR